MPAPAPAAACATAHANLALVKYWGKRDAALNLPAVGSISLTLSGLTTTTRVHFDPGLTQDECRIDGRPDAGDRIRHCLDLLRARANAACKARVHSRNDFPTGAGLASSASGFAALVTAGAAALGLELDDAERSALARRCSGSAARSIFGGFVEWHRGTADDGHDSVAEPLAPPDAWPLRVLVAVTDESAKPVGSSDGMQRSATSPFMAAWEAAQPADLERARAAIRAQDFAALAEVSEASCLKMHALALSARPGVVYWNGATVAAVHAVRALRAHGHAVFFSIDAGPQLKAVCTPEHAAAVRDALTAVPGVHRIIDCTPGGAARVLARGDAALAVTETS